jgi:hypothetical protein
MVTRLGMLWLSMVFRDQAARLFSVNSGSLWSMYLYASASITVIGTVVNLLLCFR